MAMRERWLLDRIRARVFVVGLPGVTPRHEVDLVQSCHRLIRSALGAGVPLAIAWGQVGSFVERVAGGIRTEQERETFVAIMQRLRDELFQECGYVLR
jgi:hypothetical protein